MPRATARTTDILAQVRTTLIAEAKRAAGSDATISRREELALPAGVLKEATAAARAQSSRVAAETVAKVAAQSVAELLDELNVSGKSTISKAEVIALAQRNADAGAHVARAYEMITGKHIDIAPVRASLADQLPADWKRALHNEIDQPYFKELERFLVDERARGKVEPPPDQVFAALKRTPLSKVKVVLLGQDPYPTAGNANGLSFSVPAGKPVPASLKNMFETMHKDVGAPVPNHGGLEAWADQGVLLLNTVLTVREGEPNSHKDRGWERFTQAILDKVNAKSERVVFLLLGKQAQRVSSHVDTATHSVVAVPHPSPMSPGNPFGKTRPYSAVNTALREGGRREIDWTIPHRP